MTQPERPLEAPHRRIAESSRLVEKVAVIGYKSVTVAIRYLPVSFSRAVIGRFSQLGYVLLPTKRRWSNQNFGYVLGLPPDDPRVRAMVMRAYKEYAAYMVELMRLPSRTPKEVVGLVEGDGIDRIVAAWKASGKAAIVACGHVGNNEAVAAGVADQGLPVNVVADDSTFPEIFEILRATREQYGMHVVPWRNLRELFGILRRNEMLALLVDWGYRFDGVPVKLFGHWTALPAGPATLAAKTGAVITPMVSRRTPQGRFHTEAAEAFFVPSSSPADIQRATQRIADALEHSIAAAPEQWYNFKPIWPPTEEEARQLEARAMEMLASEGTTGSRGPSADRPA